MTDKTADRPCAAAGLTSYRYRGRYGWIMIGAKDNAGALQSAARSTSAPIVQDQLEIWSDAAACYVPAQSEVTP